MIDRFIETFYKETAQLCERLEIQLSNMDLKGVSITVHGLKSHLAMVGLDTLADMAAHIEAQTESGDLDSDTREMAQQLVAELRDHT